MKSLLLLRHAKSSWSSPELDDHDRPLNKRGRRDAPRMGCLIRDGSLMPDRIISSTAVRACSTAAVIARCTGYHGPVTLDRRVYRAEPEELIEVLRELPPSCERPLLVGHNPDLEDLLAQLSGHTTALPTGALAELSVNIDDWSALSLTTPASLENLWRPRDVGEVSD